MKSVLFVNHGLGTKCGVHGYGLRVYNALWPSKTIDYQYAEPTDLDEYMDAVNVVEPDAVVFNYMGHLMPWLDCAKMRANRNVKHIVLQHLFDNESIVPIMQSYGSLFDYMVVTDPSLPVVDPRIFKIGRPIPLNIVAPIKLDETVHIGSFGFALPHKQFHLIAREVNRCFDNAVFHLHMTVGDFTGDYSAGIVDSVESELTKPGVSLDYTSDYLTDDEIVLKMSQNHMNALFYALPPDNAGLSSAADYMVAAQRPLLVSDCASFKHIHRGTYQYPTVSFDTIAGNWNWCQAHSFDLYERTAGRLQSDFESMLEKIL